jgi:hypothetical protein
MKVGENRYCLAAWGPASQDDECWQHKHTPRTESLARALAIQVYGENPSDAQVGRWMDDAAAMVDDHPDVMGWQITEWQIPANLDDVHARGDEFEEVPRSLTVRFLLNGVEYVVPEAEFEPALPVQLETYVGWFVEAPSPHPTEPPLTPCGARACTGCRVCGCPPLGIAPHPTERESEK